ncbi:hypothetical protein AHAS_Ahas20G0246400 [Arachis hypogaea]
MGAVKVDGNGLNIDGDGSCEVFCGETQKKKTLVSGRDDLGIISDRHELIREAINRSNSDWQPPRALWMFFIRHIRSNFLRIFKASYLHKLIVNIVEEYNINYRKLQERGEALPGGATTSNVSNGYWHLIRDIDGVT